MTAVRQSQDCNKPEPELQQRGAEGCNCCCLKPLSLGNSKQSPEATIVCPLLGQRLPQYLCPPCHLQNSKSLAHRRSGLYKSTPLCYSLQQVLTSTIGECISC